MNRLFGRVSEMLPELLEDVDPRGRTRGAWILIEDGARATIEPRMSDDSNPLREAFLAVADHGISGAVAVSHTFKPVEQVLACAFTRVPMDADARRAHVLRGEHGTQVGRWRAVG